MTTTMTRGETREERARLDPMLERLFERIDALTARIETLLADRDQRVIAEYARQMKALSEAIRS